jgi:hypothetical protein
MTEELIQNSQGLRDPQSIMSQQTLEQLSRELVRLCDSVERHGLVDYQMGVAEEEIMDRMDFNCPFPEREREANKCVHSYPPLPQLTRSLWRRAIWRGDVPCRVFRQCSCKESIKTLASPPQC